MPTNALSSSAQENLTAAQEILASATAWVSTNGIKFALSLLGAIAIYVVGTWVAGLIRSALINSLNRRGTDQTVNTYIANILHGLILVMVIVTALGQIGIPTAQFAALIAAAGLAIGLALQGNLSNFASGFLLVFFRPFKRGDYISAGGTEGTVEDIGIFTSTLASLDNKKIVVPNSAITGANITNFSAHPKRAVIVPCTVGGTNAPEKVRATLLGITAGNPHVLPEPVPVAVLATLGENKYTMELRA